jgi:hypothetical protein
VQFQNSDFHEAVFRIRTTELWTYPFFSDFQDAKPNQSKHANNRLALKGIKEKSGQKKVVNPLDLVEKTVPFRRAGF